MTLALLDETDLDWVAEAIDVVAAAAGKPWRVALERLDDTQRAEQLRAPIRFAAIVGALQRVLGGRGRNAQAARAARSLVLGKPVLTEAEREARIGAAGELEVTMRREDRGHAVVGLAARAPDRAAAGPTIGIRGRGQRKRLPPATRDDARPDRDDSRVGRCRRADHAAAARGLLTTFSRGANDEVVLDIVGPLALFHRTGVYGRALASLVPLLAGCDRFELEVARARDQVYTVAVSSPVLLPPVPVRMALPALDLARLCNELGRVARDAVVTPRPPPLAAGTSLVCPDLLLEHGARTTYVEIIGFWTSEYLEKKRLLYRAAGVDVLFCVDDARGCTKDELQSDVPFVRFSRRATHTAREIAAWFGDESRYRS